VNQWQVRTIIRSFLKNNHPPDIFPVKLRLISEVLGATIYYRPLPESVSGLLLPLKNKEYIITINNNMTPGHQRFTLAHELSHIILRHPAKAVSPMLYTPDETFRFGVTPYEREANIAAVEMLMPERKVRELCQHGIPAIDRLCEFFAVSASAMRIRLEELGITQNYAQRIF
jgi:Zn-dependent peptidase ImmA (M78 family)